SILPGLQNANQVLDNWLNEFEYMRRITDWGVLTYTFHPFVIGRGHRMLMLEKLVQRLADSGANFTTLADAATEYARRDPLQPDA
ncbi:MAG: polysaccharide deacetylase family protein, partial [Burkholderiales bacterium]